MNRMPDNSMAEEEREPSDQHYYQGFWWQSDTLNFFLCAVKFYQGLLESDLEAIAKDPDLRLILGENEPKDLKINEEVQRASRFRSWLEKEATAASTSGTTAVFNVSHGTIRYLKSVSLLYIQHLLRRREDIAARPNVSKHALSLVDQRIAYLQGKVGSGVFLKATPLKLLADEANSVKTDALRGSAVSESLAEQKPPKPVVLDSIEILDSALRKRCLDLFVKFQEDGQEDRLDTVVNEATRILEDRLRRLSGAAENCVGMDLATYCFAPANARLIVSKISSEQEAAHLLFRGVFGLIRNKVHHHLIGNLTAQRVLQVVGMVDYLLSVAEAATMPEDGNV